MNCIIKTVEDDTQENGYFNDFNFITHPHRYSLSSERKPVIHNSVEELIHCSFFLHNFYFQVLYLIDRSRLYTEKIL